jgi:hypothetical protein
LRSVDSTIRHPAVIRQYRHGAGVVCILDREGATPTVVSNWSGYVERGGCA